MSDPALGLVIALTAFVTVPVLVLVLCAIVDIRREARRPPPKTKLDALRERYMDDKDDLDSIDFALAVMALEDPDEPEPVGSGEHEWLSVPSSESPRSNVMELRRAVVANANWEIERREREESKRDRDRAAVAELADTPGESLLSDLADKARWERAATRARLEGLWQIQPNARPR